jgi:hypothetical protein
VLLCCKRCGLLRWVDAEHTSWVRKSQYLSDLSQLPAGQSSQQQNCEKGCSATQKWVVQVPVLQPVSQLPAGQFVTAEKQVGEQSANVLQAILLVEVGCS